MFPKNRRIPRKMFPLLKKGKMYKNNLFLIKIASQPDPSSRFCFSVSKKIAKNAVMRNKMRRAGYRLLKNYIDKIKPNYLTFFSFRMIPKDDTEIIKNIESALLESKLIK